MAQTRKGGAESGRRKGGGRRFLTGIPKGIGVLATEHSAPFYARFGFQLEGDPQLDPFAGYHIHRMSMAYAPVLGQSADSLLDGLERVTFDTSADADPFAEDEATQ